MNLNEEQKTSLECAFLLFSVTCALILLKSTRDALYLSGYSTRNLPYLMGANTVTTALVAVSYLRLYKAVSLKSAVSVSFLVYFAGTLVFWWWVSGSSKMATLSLYIWAGIFGTLAPVHAWSIVSSRLLVRQARRSLGLIGGGAIVGGIAGGLLAQFIADASAMCGGFHFVVVVEFLLAWSFGRDRASKRKIRGPNSCATEIHCSAHGSCWHTDAGVNIHGFPV
jgi:hypothetical protein